MKLNYKLLRGDDSTKGDGQMDSIRVRTEGREKRGDSYWNCQQNELSIRMNWPSWCLKKKKKGRKNKVFLFKITMAYASKMLRMSTEAEAVAEALIERKCLLSPGRSKQMLLWRPTRFAILTERSAGFYCSFSFVIYNVNSTVNIFHDLHSSYIIQRAYGKTYCLDRPYLNYI